MNFTFVGGWIDQTDKMFNGKIFLNLPLYSEVKSANSILNFNKDLEVTLNG